MGGKEKIFLSACLAGINCTYNGKNKSHPVFVQMHKEGRCLIGCPEVLGGFKIPHNPSEIVEGSGRDVLEGKSKVLSSEGRDVTEFFLKGARAVSELMETANIKKAVLKSKSPSCGSGQIYDGTFSHRLVSGDGVTTALLKMNGIEVLSDVEYLENQSTDHRPWSTEK